MLHTLYWFKIRPIISLFLLISSIVAFAQSPYDYKGRTSDTVTSFTKVHFDDYTDFTDASFNKKVDFFDAHFKFQTEFFNCRFNTFADFKEAKFDSAVSFHLAKFGHKVTFEEAEFKGEVNFKVRWLPDTLDFTQVKLKHPLDLTSSSLDPNKIAMGAKCRINLIDAPIEKFILTYDNFLILKPEVITSRYQYQKLNAIYERLLKNFKDRGYLSSYEILDKEYQEFKFTENPDDTWLYRITIGNGMNWLNWYWSDYGYEKVRIWGHTCLFLLIFTFVNFWKFDCLRKNVYEIKSIDEAIGRKPDRAFAYAFFYTCLVFFGLQMSTDKIKFDQMWGVLYIFFQYLVGLVCLGYLANFIISSQLIGA